MVQTRRSAAKGEAGSLDMTVVVDQTRQLDNGRNRHESPSPKRKRGASVESTHPERTEEQPRDGGSNDRNEEPDAKVEDLKKDTAPDETQLLQEVIAHADTIAPASGAGPTKEGDALANDDLVPRQEDPSLTYVDTPDRRAGSRATTTSPNKRRKVDTIQDDVLPEQAASRASPPLRAASNPVDPTVVQDSRPAPPPHGSLTLFADDGGPADIATNQQSSHRDDPETPTPEEGPAESEDSDDEAPEAISRETALNKARALETEAAKAIEHHEAAAKRKRQDRDSRLKEQAEASKAKRKTRRASVSSADGNAFQQGKTASKKRRLPALLPEEILAVERVPSPSPPAASGRRGQAQETSRRGAKRIVFDNDDKPIKDVKRGPVSVRVISKPNSLLPPKAVAPSKSLREDWLMGRKGRNGEPMVQRKSRGGGFLVNSTATRA